MLWRKRPTRDMLEACSKIRTTAVVRKPYPHIVVFDALPQISFDLIRSAWPHRSEMWNEAAHDRHWCYFQGASSNVWSRDAWPSIMTDVIDPMFAAIADRLRPYFEGRYSGEIELEPRLLALHEAGGEFVEHKPHTHFEHNPRYAFTVLYCVEDDGFQGRGTTLYGYHNLPDRFSGDDDDTLMHKTSGQLFSFSRPDVVVPFEPNRLLAFVDGPMSIHGSTPFTKASGARRMILSHVTERKAEQEVSAADCVKQFIDYRNGGTIKPWMTPILAKERAVIRAWR